MQRKPISWILEFTSKLPNDEEKIKCLRANDHPAIKTLLQYCFHPNIKWLLPDGEVPFKPASNEGDLDNMLYQEARRLYLFVEGGNPNLKQARRETLFIELMQNILPADARMIEVMKDKKSPWPGLTYDVVKKAFPELF